MDEQYETTEDRCPVCGMTEEHCEVMRDVREGYAPQRPEPRWITWTRRQFEAAA